MLNHPIVISRRTLGALVLFAYLTPAIAQNRETSRTVALTFDDLPYVARPFPETMQKAARVNKAILKTLATHHAPALGLVNAARLQRPGEANAQVALLKAWVDSGMTLGNH